MNDGGCQPFAAWMQRRLEDGPLAPEEVVRALVPLLRQVQDTHERGLVAPLAGLRCLQVADGVVFFAAVDAVAPRSNAPAIARIEGRDGHAIDIASRQVLDTTGPIPVAASRDLLPAGAPPESPAFLPGYLAWEHAVEHHDPLTDVFSLGLLLASLSLGLDLAEDEDLHRFVDARTNPFAINPRLHPVIARCLIAMTEPRRRRRTGDLPAIIALLVNHRDQTGLSWSLDLAGPPDGPRSRRQRILERLRDRLFDCSRRNRLLHYKPTMGHLDLTIASVPVMLDVDAICPDDLCTWRGTFAAGMLSGEPVNLGRWLRNEDAPYLPGTLDRIRVEEKRDRAEYGASHLRLVVASLRWHDLKEDPRERITSPLLLLPVTIEKRKGVRDAWTLTAADTTAEVNPVLRHHLRQRYGLELPEAIQLAETPVEVLHDRLLKAIQASEPGVTLHLVDRPRIDLVLMRARARSELHQRRSRLTGRGVRRLDDIDYSYDRDNFRGLGLQIFLQRVKPVPFPLALAGGDAAAPNSRGLVAPSGTDVRARETYVLREEGEANPYAWDLDLCNVTLGNFNYRKMSLVRDYRALLERDAAHAGFDTIFAELARPVDEAAAYPADPLELWLAVPSDPTQDAAVGRAHTGASYVIQGPPGTGKSQTITNLIADHAARGKRVLFVCAKRAALDVVHHRLAQRGLDRLCCLIHDSQDDKKPFIQALRAHYEAWLQQADEAVARRQDRERIRSELRAAAEPLARFAQAMLAADPIDGITVRDVLERLVALAARLPADAAAAAMHLPGYALWSRFSAPLRALAAGLGAAGREPVFARLGLRHARAELFRGERPAQAMAAALEAGSRALARLQEALGPSCCLELLGDASLAEMAAVVADARRLLLLAERDLLRLLDRSDPAHGQLRSAVRERRTLAEAADAATAKTRHWITPLPAGDCAAVLAQAQELETGGLRFLRPAWWRLRRILRERYRFSAHVVPPRWSVIVADLAAAYAARDALAVADRAFAATWKVDDLQVLVALLDALQVPGRQPGPVVRLRQWTRAGRLDAAALAILAGAATPLEELQRCCEVLFARWQDRTLAAIAEDGECLRRDLPLIAQLLPSLRSLAEAPPVLWDALRDRPWDAEGMEAAILQAALERSLATDAGLARLDHHALAAAAARLRTLHRALSDGNARLILAEAHARFLERARRAGHPGAADAAERTWRRDYARGRRELEHEFSKVMRYRSLRDLADDETGMVVADLKPIWLMSPLSVSDTLPLEGSGFDVVIFDEASQIPIEEAIPALHRAPQCIVVGDRQQLPPTAFFASAAGDDEAPGAAEEDALRFDLEHDSFLAQAAANLPGTMLGWHYRSRSESLIAFSNAAFYDGRLMTIPDVAFSQGSGAIPVATPEQGAERAEQVLDRPISFHLLAGSPYGDRRNQGEAVYVARLVRELLARATGQSLGVVAFSEAQQGEIERALQALGQEDAAFRNRYEAEMQREDEGQFCGLFIKNLENVQGDERDIIILSICYGPDRNGRMAMYFGPINQSGGEKRLNVVFSRARRHMVVVSSITADAITNDHNTGAGTLKSYLAYAAAASAGDRDRADRVLAALSTGPEPAGREPTHPLADAVSRALTERGFAIATRVGRSRFRCDIAVRREGDDAFRLGIIIDDEQGYRDLSLWERELARPASLDAFGWTILHLHALDWWRERDVVLERIQAMLARPGPVS